MCDVGRVAVKHCFKLLSFLQLYFAVLLQVADSIKLISRLNTVAIAHKGVKIVAIWQHNKRVLSIFSPRVRRNGYLGTSGQKSDPAIRSGDLDFL